MFAHSMCIVVFQVYLKPIVQSQSNFHLVSSAAFRSIFILSIKNCKKCQRIFFSFNIMLSYFIKFSLFYFKTVCIFLRSLQISKNILNFILAISFQVFDGCSSECFFYFESISTAVLRDFAVFSDNKKDEKLLLKTFRRFVCSSLLTLSYQRKK